MQQTDSPTDSSPDPETWLLSNLPHTTFSEDAFAYLDTGSGHSTQFYSVEWLAEEFGEIIANADHPKQQLLTAALEDVPAELRRLFGQIDE
ncbi:MULTISPECIES: hypothetical protein [Haloarcula]|uniref:hypothetical protein n=1 Tax=Haloarcula TaxID=2237 RepID=UPI0023E8BF22|nr:hypothetical protein [Halomicroarcula sp. SHR3]